MKIHYYDYKTLQYADKHAKQMYAKEGIDGAKCGYVRKVTRNKNEVTCKLCLRALQIKNDKL